MQSVLTHNSKISFKSNLIPIKLYCSYDKKMEQNNIWHLGKKKMIQQAEAGTEMLNFLWILSKRTKEQHL